MSAAYNNPIMPDIPKRKMTMPTEATRVAAHKADGVKNDLSAKTMTEKTPAMGHLGVTGDGKSK